MESPGDGYTFTEELMGHFLFLHASEQKPRPSQPWSEISRLHLRCPRSLASPGKTVTNTVVLTSVLDNYSVQKETKVAWTREAYGWQQNSQAAVIWLVGSW